jgi:hypothetical protein
MDDSHLDAVIDEAARLMTAGEPRIGFRERVLARIEEGSGFRVPGFGFTFKVRGPGSPLWRPVLVGLVVALVIVAISLFRGPTPVDRQAADQEPRRNQPEVRARTETASVSKPEAAVLRRKPTATGEGVTRNARVDMGDADIERLTTEPLQIDSIAVAGLPAEESIQVEPLESVTPIAVTPLGPENQGDRR